MSKTVAITVVISLLFPQRFSSKQLWKKDSWSTQSVVGRRRNKENTGGNRETLNHIKQRGKTKEPNMESSHLTVLVWRSKEQKGHWILWKLPIPHGKRQKIGLQSCSHSYSQGEYAWSSEKNGLKKECKGGWFRHPDKRKPESGGTRRRGGWKKLKSLTAKWEKYFEECLWPSTLLNTPQKLSSLPKWGWHKDMPFNPWNYSHTSDSRWTLPSRDVANSSRSAFRSPVMRRSWGMEDFSALEDWYEQPQPSNLTDLCCWSSCGVRNSPQSLKKEDRCHDILKSCCPCKPGRPGWV